MAIEALSSLGSRWSEILSFDLQLKNLIHPANYNVYTNQPDYLGDKELAEGAAKLARMRHQYGLSVERRPS